MLRPSPFDKLLCWLCLPYLWLTAGAASAETTAAQAAGAEIAGAQTAGAETGAAAERVLPGFESFIDEIVGLDFLAIPIWRATAAILVVLAGVFLRKHLLDKLLEPARMLAARTRSDLDDRLLAAIYRPLGWVINIVAIYLATLLLALPAGLFAVTTLVLKTVGTVFVAWMAFNIVDAAAGFLEVLAKHTESEIGDHLVPLLRRVLRGVLVIVTGIMIIQQWGYDVTSLVAGLGLGGLAFALAAQSTLSNWFGSVMILTDRPFGVGDLVKCAHGEGVIEEIGLRSTRIRTFNRTIITVPNADIATAAVENFSKNPVRAIKADVRLAYSTPHAQVTAVIDDIRQMFASHPDVDQSFHMVHLVGFGPSSLDIRVHCFTETTDWHRWFQVRQDLFLAIKAIVERNGCKFALPAQALHFEAPPVVPPFEMPSPVMPSPVMPSPVMPSSTTPSPVTPAPSAHENAEL